MALTVQEFAGMLDANLSKSTATKRQVDELLAAARRYEIRLLFAPKCWLPYMARQVHGTATGIGGAAGTVLGTDPTALRLAYVDWCLENGAEEIDMVMNMSYFKSGMYGEVQRDIEAVRAAAGEHILKCIIEAPLLDEAETRRATAICIDAGVDFVKTGSGTTGPATPRQVELIAAEARGRAGIKAAGGIRTLAEVERLRGLGVTRFGIGAAAALELLAGLEG